MYNMEDANKDEDYLKSLRKQQYLQLVVEHYYNLADDAPLSHYPDYNVLCTEVFCKAWRHRFDWELKDKFDENDPEHCKLMVAEQGVGTPQLVKMAVSQRQ